MSIESTLSIVASLLAIGGAILGGYKYTKKKPLTALMNELADKNTSVTRQHQILSIIDKRLILYNQRILSSYIKNFYSNGRSKLAIFYDICNKNDIEPTTEICQLLLGFDERKFRNEWTARHITEQSTPTESARTQSEHHSLEPSVAGEHKVFLSSLLASRYPAITQRLTDVLDHYNIPHTFLEGTKDVWCRDYMPVQTPSGKLIQFKYEPSYLSDPKYSHMRTDVKYVNEVNEIHPIFSEINLDGGNVVMYGNKAIITDRIFSENPNWTKHDLIHHLSNILECEVIIIPAYKPEYDFTGHADGMIRFVNDTTVLVNDLEKDFVYMKKAMIAALEDANLRFINFPFFEYKIKGNSEHAIGVYLNYLEVDNLILMPVFGVPGNMDAEAFATLQKVFPAKVIETINCTDLALSGGLLNCATWVVKQ